MTPRFSVIVPVLDGARYLHEVLDAVRAQDREVELIVVDSGSGDGSQAIARAAGAELIEIAREEFRHGRTRNLAAERATGDLLCFLTQDATPVPGWLAAYESAFALDETVGAAFGPHLPRADTPVMIARELTEFFAGFPAGVLGDGEHVFLSNVNACYRRACWEQVRFDDVRYSEDQAFARALHGSGWRRAYVPDAAVAHAHDFSPLDFARRYFDEYRGLRETSGHIERIGVRSTVREVRSQVAADRRWMDQEGWAGRRRVAATGRSAVHHTSRRLASALGSHGHRLPAPVQKAISLEGRAAEADHSLHVAPKGRPVYAAVGAVAHDGAVPLLEPVPGLPQRFPLHIAVVIPPFKRGSGGHSTIYNLLSRLEDRGHTVSTWLYDPANRMASEWPAVLRESLREYFRPINGPVFKGFEHWYGADVVIATGWDTVYPVLRLENVFARAYLVQDHEPEFFATSAESVFAERTYREGLYVIAASPWLRELMETRYGATGTHFELGVDHGIYHPRNVGRRGDTVIFYAREATARRAVPLGILALQELHRRRPDTRFVLFGSEKPVDAPFPYESLGVISPEQLSWAYSEATVGLSLSLTNYSLIPQEMLACGLPVVELAGRAIESVYGADGPIELAEADPVRIADALELLLNDQPLHERRSRDGIEFVSQHNWDHATDEVEAGLRAALQARIERPAAGAAAAGPLAAADSARIVPVDRTSGREATDRLYARLDESDVAAVFERLEPSWREHWSHQEPEYQRTLALILGAWYGVEPVLAKTGLSAAQPPEDVHAMARGPLAGGGSLYYADMLAQLLRGAGSGLEAVRRGLDFGSSSGRTVRALAAAYPQAEWHGIDPNADAIAWANTNLPAIRFAVSPQDPPLDYADGYFDFVVAISIWSHYAEPAAIRWLAEMHRIIRPGGYFVFSTHGPQSVAYYGQTGERTPAQLGHIRRELHRSGYWFAPEFGEAGDWGVLHPEWGTAFFTPEWVARMALPQWSIEDYAVGQNADNQDMYVLRRR